MPQELSEGVDEARRIALELLAVRDRSVREMGERLQKRGCHDDAIALVVRRLCAAGLLDDHLFVRRWVSGRLERRPEGRAKLVQDLCRRGVDRGVVEQVLEEFEERIGDDDAADRVLQRVRHRYARLDEVAARRRMYSLLARRGFDSDTARGAVERALVELKDTTAP